MCLSGSTWKLLWFAKFKIENQQKKQTMRGQRGPGSAQRVYRDIQLNVEHTDKQILWKVKNLQQDHRKLRTTTVHSLERPQPGLQHLCHRCLSLSKGSEETRSSLLAQPTFGHSWNVKYVFVCSAFNFSQRRLYFWCQSSFRVLTSSQSCSAGASSSQFVSVNWGVKQSSRL